MTDNEIMECFKLGTSLCSNDDVDRADINNIIKELENCAEHMLPYIHKYYTDKKKACKDCVHFSRKENKCSYAIRQACIYSLDKKEFRRK